MRRRELFLDLAALALLALAVAVFFWPLLVADYWVPRGGGDLVSFLWPVYRFAARSLRKGTVPLWNPHLYSGAPFVADNQSGIFYPINLLTFALLGEPSYAAMEGLAILHIWLAGASTFVLARGLGLRRAAAVLGALSFALSDLFVTHIGNLNLNATAAWLPLTLLLTHRALTRRSAGWAAGAGVVLAVAALAGHAQMLLFLGLTLGLYVIWRLTMDHKQGWRYELGTLKLMTVTAAIGLGGAALMLVPAYQMAAHTGRGHLPYDEATHYSLPPQALIGLLAPGFYGRGPAGFWGPWDRVEVGYAGVATLVLAAVGIGAGLEPPGNRGCRNTRPARRFPTSFFALLVPLAFLLAMGRHTPLYGLLYHWIPTLDQLRAPARLIVLADLGLAALAAYGLDRLPEIRRVSPAFRDWINWLALATLIAAGVLLIMGLPWAQSAPPPDRVPQATRSILIAAMLLVLSGLLAWLAGRERQASWLVALLLASDLIGLGSTVEIEPNDPTLGFLHEDVAAFLQRDSAPYRIEDSAEAWQPDAALVYGLYDIDGVYNPLGLAPYHAYRWAMGEPGTALYNLLGIKYVLRDKDSPPGNKRLVPVYTKSPEINIYLNAAALPRALVVPCSQTVPDHGAAWQAIHDSTFDPTKTVILEQKQIADLRQQAGECKAQTDVSHITFAHYGLNEVELKVQTSANAYLVLSDVYYPGWHATVDDEPTRVLRADYTFRAVALPAGEHTVQMTFAPWTWRVGLAVSAVTWLALALWGGANIRKLLKRIQ